MIDMPSAHWRANCRYRCGCRCRHGHFFTIDRFYWVWWVPIV